MNPQKLFEKFLNKTATPEELSLLLSYIKDHPKEQFSQLVKKEWDKNSPQHHTDLDFSQIISEIKGPQKIKHKRLFHFPSILKWVASVTLMIFLTYLVYNATSQYEPEKEIVVKTIEKVNPNGQKSKIFLPDGSTVWLNSNSKLTFPDRFDSVRQVTLEGEAYFEVVSNKEKPFLVTSGSLTTEALGTEFNVKAYPEEDEIMVALTHGKIKVSVGIDDSNQDYFVEPGLSILFNKSSQKAEESTFQQHLVVGWKEGLLSFNDAGRAEVFEELQRWYGVEFQYENTPSDKSWNYTGQFDNEYLENVLLSIGAIKNFDFNIDNKSVTITYN